MGKWEKVLERILSGNSDANVRFDDLCGLLERLGFEKRTQGSHSVFRRDDIVERPNLQRDGTHAKPYQVRQVGEIVRRYKLGDEI